MAHFHCNEACEKARNETTMAQPASFALDMTDAEDFSIGGQDDLLWDGLSINCDVTDEELNASFSSSTHSSSTASEKVDDNLSDFFCNFDQERVFHDEDSPRSEQEIEQATSRSVSPTSSISSGASSPSMDSLTLCMEKSAVTRALVEKFCKTNLKFSKQVAAGRLPVTCIKKTTVLKQSKKIKHSVCLAPVALFSTSPPVLGTHSAKKARPSAKKTKTKTDPAFRLSGLKLSEEKSRRLEMKLRLLEQTSKLSPLPASSSSVKPISNFLRQQKSTVPVEIGTAVTNMF
mmetsp:Transcript_18460/g.32572  ORF Transcript_18460/g.32572 Transcript_18460/m.32572 type:complete len:289 (-) Transcript_18460:45-911(-)